MNSKIPFVGSVAVYSMALILSGCGGTISSPGTSPGTATLTSTPAFTATSTPTGTPTPTGTWFTPTPIMTGTPCRTATWTPTATCVFAPFYYIQGSVSYSGTSGVHPIYVHDGNAFAICSNLSGHVSVVGGTYLLAVKTPGVHRLSGFYDRNDLVPLHTLSPAWEPLNLPGMRYSNTGSCANPVVIGTLPVTVSGALGTTFTGPTFVIDDLCSYWGIYGNTTYTGNRGTVGLCRGIHLRTFSDAAYSTPLSWPWGSDVEKNGGAYALVTNDQPGAPGLSPFYLQAYFDANGNYFFDTGDPYLDMGLVTPTQDGLLLNITFGDTFIK